jgi:CubicO group peptidase (beta-lactamase class C family)
MSVSPWFCSRRAFASRFRGITLAILFLCGIRASAAQQSPDLGDFDPFVAKAMKAFKVPGAAIAIVKDGKIILAKGYGYRDMENKLPVTTKTVFPIASISKSFTVTTLGMLVDKGKVEWDKPVRDYLPGFRMYDPVATEQLTVRDLITHRSGLPRHDLVWYSSNFTRKQVVDRLRYLESNKPLRQSFQYNNLMFITAGYLAGELNDSSWEQAVQGLVLNPLRMTTTVFSSADAQKTPDHALPYRKNWKTQEVKQIAFADWGDIGPAGGINTNIDDLSRYLLLHIEKGNFEGKRLLSENSSAQMQTPQMVIQGTPNYKELGEGSYGMGLFISSYRGHKMIEHGGNLDGFALELAFLPQERIGVVILTNLDGTAFRDEMAYNVFDRQLGLNEVPWTERFLQEERKSDQAEATGEHQGLTGQKKGTHPSHEMKEYVGEFSNPGYGTVTIAQADSAASDLKLTLNRLSRPVHHFHYDTFAVAPDPLDPLEKTKVTFNTDLKGNISSLSMPLESQVKPIVFERAAEKQMFRTDFLEQFVGDYDLPGTTLSITLQGNTLVGSTPGSPVLTLVPKHGTTFDIKTRPGSSVEFRRDPSGKVTDIVFETPESSFVFKRK